MSDYTDAHGGEHHEPIHGQFPPIPGHFTQNRTPPAQTPPLALEVGDALAFGWNKFKSNPGPWLGFVAILCAAFAVLFVVIFSITFSVAMSELDKGRPLPTDSGASGGSLPFVWALIGPFAGYFVSTAFVRGGLTETSGYRATLGTFFAVGRSAQIAVAALVMATASAVSDLVPGATYAIPFLGFIAWFVPAFILDRHHSAATAFASSARLTLSNALRLVLLMFAIIAVNIVGVLPCGLGLLVTVPVTAIAGTYAFRVLTGGPISV